MSKLPDDKKIILTNIPGSHDSTAYYMNIFGSVFAKCQNLNIMEQLRIGVRKFDIRVASNQCTFSCNLNPLIADNDLDLICCHGICDCYYINEQGIKKNITYKDVLLDMKQFLEEFNTETIILMIESGRGNKYNNIKRSIEIFDKIMGDISIKYNKDLTLKDVRGKIIYTDYITNKRDFAGKLIYNSGLDGGQGLDKIHQKFVPDFTYEVFKVDGRLKVEEIKEFFNLYNMTFEEAEKDFEKNNKKYPFSYCFSCTGEYESIVPLPKSQADIVNTFIVNYELKKGNYYGWINIDFVDLDITKKIIETNFLDIME